VKGIVVASAVVVGLTACARQHSGQEGAAATTAAAPTQATATAPPEVWFNAKEFTFEGPDTIQSGMTTLVLTDKGGTYHHLQLIRLLDGKTVADVRAAVKQMKPGSPMPPWMEAAGGVNVVDPGARTRATLMIEPGDYAIVCLVDTPDHVPHFMKGMIKALTVTPSDTPSAPPPAADLTVTMADYSFTLSQAPTAGHHVFRVTNKGPQDHEMGVIRLAPGKTVDDILKWGAGPTDGGPIPGTTLGGVPETKPGQTEYVPLDLTPGNYVLICFVPDKNDGKPHVTHGMVSTFTVS
jgi:hypothetical protein